MSESMIRSDEPGLIIWTGRKSLSSGILSRHSVRVLIGAFRPGI